MDRLTHDTLIGNHLPNNGEGLTVQDLIDLLRSIPTQARSNYLQIDREDVTGLSIGQSDQAGKWEFKIHIKHTGS